MYTATLLRFARSLALTAVFLTLVSPSAAQPTGAELVTSALVRPLGLATDAAGNVWTAETGRGTNDGRISVVFPDGQVFPFLIGIPSASTPQGVRSVSHLAFAGEDVWFTASVSHTESSLRRISTAGWTPGDPPRTMTDVALTVDVSDFLFFEGFKDTNPHGIALGPDGALYFTDAGANALLRYDLVADELSVLVTFPDLPTGSGPPTVQTVPTGIVATDGQLYVAALTGFPFFEGLARVYDVAFDGTFAVLHGGLTALTDLARDPRDGALTAVQHGVWGGSNWQLGTGRAVRLNDERELASGFDLTTGAAYAPDGTLYVCTLGGALYRVDSNPVANEPVAEAAHFALLGNRPNPFVGSTTLTYSLTEAAHARLSVYDVLGREVAVLVDGERASGSYEAVLDGSRLPGGAYVARLTVGTRSLTHRLVAVR